MKILILSSAFNGLSQRVQRELLQLGHELRLHIDLDPAQLRQELQAFNPALVVCPFLTQRIPEDIWRNWLCLVVHPGIEGDRGPSSLDWAIQNKDECWGVTLLQADKEMDAGNIWGTAEFPLRGASKLSIYKREVSTAAVALIKNLLNDFQNPHFHARPLDYNRNAVRGRLRPFMKQARREINWCRDSTATVLQKIRAADTSPGVMDSICGVEVYLYGGVQEPSLRGPAGDIIATTDDAICRATKDGAVWIRQLKCMSSDQLPPIKLPATTVLKNISSKKQWQKISHLSSHAPIADMWVERRDAAAFVYFNCYNGAFSTHQCQKLLQMLQAVKRSDAKFIVLMGGNDFWSNGIQLNCIEAAEDSAEESWQNIHAIDDVVLEIIDSPQHMTIAALRNNSGAGGSIMALACDEVIIRAGTVHNPHYQSMGLYGSEYWTYLLPKKVGSSQAEALTRDCEPLLASEAMQLGFADALLAEDWQTYHQQLFAHLARLGQHWHMEGFLRAKAKQRQTDEALKPLAQYREEELQKMRAIFFNPASDYHLLRHNFVNKIKTSKISTAAPELRTAI